MAARRQPAIQPNLPLLEEDGQTHRLECECPRCDAGFRPSDGQRQTAARRWQEQQEREAAAALLARKRARDRIKAWSRTVALEQAEQETLARLRAEAALRLRLQADDRLAVLLARRRAGEPPDQAIAETEKRFPPRRS